MLQGFSVSRNADFVRCYTPSGTHIRKELPVAMAVIFVAHPINKSIQTAADEHQNSQRVMQFRVGPRFSRHCKGVVDLIWRETDHQHDAGDTDHPCHLPAHFLPCLLPKQPLLVNLVNHMRKQTEHCESWEDQLLGKPGRRPQWCGLNLHARLVATGNVVMEERKNHSRLQQDLCSREERTTVRPTKCRSESASC